MSEEKEKIDPILLLLIIFLGWLGIDKIYKKDWVMFAVKFFSLFIIIGVLWNILDIVHCIKGNYKNDPRDYLN